MYVYADNAATTALSQTALEAMMPCFQEEYANPSSLHTPGQRAAEKLAQAREIFARHLHADPREIVFTSGGSEADTQALRSAAALGAGRGSGTSFPPVLSTTRCSIPWRPWRKRGLPLPCWTIPPGRSGHSHGSAGGPPAGYVPGVRDVCQQ